MHIHKLHLLTGTVSSGFVTGVVVAVIVVIIVVIILVSLFKRYSSFHLTTFINHIGFGIINEDSNAGYTV